MKDRFDERLKELNPVQKEIVKITHEMCNILDTSRGLSHTIRLDLLSRVYRSLHKFKKRVEEIKGSSKRDKQMLTSRLLRELKDS